MATPELTPRRTRVVMAVFAADTLEDRAREAGLSTRTFQREYATEVVQQEIHRITITRLRGTGVALSRYVERAAFALGEMATGTVQANSARVRACEAVLEHAQRYRELEDHEGRLRDLEARALTEPQPAGSWPQ